MGNIAQYIYDSYGKFPGSVDTHANHMGRWHDDP